MDGVLDGLVLVNDQPSQVLDDHVLLEIHRLLNRDGWLPQIVKNT